MKWPLGLRAAYRRAVEVRLGNDTAARRPVSEADLERLPTLVRQYLRRVGAVGLPRPRHLRARWRGAIRGSATEAWMPFTAEQHNFLDEPARLFFMRARRGMVPVSVYHTYDRDEASMRARILSIPVVNASGAELRRAETVTVLNDICLLAPGALVDLPVEWEELDASRVRARYTAGADTIAADLEFDPAGDLVDFVSDDRLQSVDGGAFEQRRWSTPVSGHRSFGPVRALSRGEGRWHTAEGSFAYIELELLDLELDGRAQSGL